MTATAPALVPRSLQPARGCCSLMGTAAVAAAAPWAVAGGIPGPLRAAAAMTSGQVVTRLQASARASTLGGWFPWCLPRAVDFPSSGSPIPLAAFHVTSPCPPSPQSLRPRRTAPTSPTKTMALLPTMPANPSWSAPCCPACTARSCWVRWRRSSCWSCTRWVQGGTAASRSPSQVGAGLRGRVRGGL